MSGNLSYATALMALLTLATICVARASFVHWRRTAGPWLFLATVVMGFLLTLIRIEGLSAVNLMLSLTPSLSILSLGLLLQMYLDEVFDLSILQPAELLWWAGFVLFVSLPLYASVLGLIPRMATNLRGFTRWLLASGCMLRGAGISAWRSSCLVRSRCSTSGCCPRGICSMP